MKVPFVNPAINAAVSIFAASSFQILTPQPLLAAPTLPPVQIVSYLLISSSWLLTATAMQACGRVWRDDGNLVHSMDGRHGTYR